MTTPLVLIPLGILHSSCLLLKMNSIHSERDLIFYGDIIDSIVRSRSEDPNLEWRIDLSFVLSANVRQCKLVLDPSNSSARRVLDPFSLFSSSSLKLSIDFLNRFYDSDANLLI